MAAQTDGKIVKHDEYDEKHDRMMKHRVVVQMVRHEENVTTDMMENCPNSVNMMEMIKQMMKSRKCLGE